MKTPVKPRMQLWIEETEVLAGYAASIPDGGTIVEIGTAEGATSLLMHEATKGRGAKIYTVDIAPSRVAREALKDTEVTIVPQSSEIAAAGWPQGPNRPIDFLFIDGGHDLEHIVNDWNLWVPLLRPGGLVAIHDYDPAKRGGVAHFAIRIAVDTILRAGFLKEPEHKYKLVSGSVEKPLSSQISPKDCYTTLSDVGKTIAEIQDGDYSDTPLAMGGRLASLLKNCLKGATDLEVLSPQKVNSPKKKYLVCSQPDETAQEVLLAKGIPGSQIVLLDSLIICYLLADALRWNYAALRELASPLPDFLIWAEGLEMFEHALGPSLFPHDLSSVPELSDLHSLSSLVAREQVRLLMLTRLLRTFVDWIP